MARDRVRELSDFIAADDSAAAKKWVQSLFEQVEILREAPESGRTVPELSREDTRELIYGSYRIIYRVDAEGVGILTVRHGRRLLDLGDVLPEDEDEDGG